MDKMFELEQKILQCWNVIDDLRSVLDKWDDVDSQERDEIHTIWSYYKYRFDGMWAVFEQAFSEACNLKKLAKREEPPF